MKSQITEGGGEKRKLPQKDKGEKALAARTCGLRREKRGVVKKKKNRRRGNNC